MPEVVPATCPVVDTPPTGEIDDCLVTVDGNSASSEESPDSGCDTYKKYTLSIIKILCSKRNNIINDSRYAIGVAF